MVCFSKLSKSLCAMLWSVAWHYDIQDVICGENLLESFYDWMRSLIREFFDVKPLWAIVYHDDVVSSLKIIQVCCYLLPGLDWEGRKHMWLLGRWVVLGTSVSSSDELTDLFGESRPPYGRTCPGSTLSHTQVTSMNAVKDLQCHTPQNCYAIIAQHRSKSSTIVRWLLLSQL